MRLIDQFQKLHAFVVKHPNQPGLPALATALSCSERNARLLLRKMEEKGWLRWEAARGRGHFSRLSMLVSPQQVALDHLSGLVADGELEQAFASLDGEQRKQLAARLPDFLHQHNENGPRDRLRIPVPRPVRDLDPLDISTGLEALLATEIFSRLIEFDSVSQRLIPALAHYWESEESGTVWHFWLRPALSFHDGSPLEPKDVQHTLLRLRDKPNKVQYLYGHLMTVEIGGCGRVTCRLSQSDYLWPHCLASVNASIVPISRAADFALIPVGSGAFQLTRRSDYRITLSAFPDYYRERALLDEIDLWVISQSEDSSDFDVHFGLLSGGPETHNTMTKVQSGCYVIGCNATRPFFKTVSQRLALADWLAPSVLLDPGDTSRMPASGLMPSWNHRAASPAGRPRVPKGNTLTLVTILSADGAALAHDVKHRLQEADIDVELVVLPYDEFLQCGWRDFADLVLYCEGMAQDIDMGCYEWFASNDPFRQWMPKARRALLDVELNAIRGTNDAHARMGRYAAIGKQLVDEAWLIPIAHEVRSVHVASHVGGADEMSFGLVPFSGLWLR